MRREIILSKLEDVHNSLLENGEDPLAFLEAYDGEQLELNVCSARLGSITPLPTTHVHLCRRITCHRLSLHSTSKVHFTSHLIFPLGCAT